MRRPIWNAIERKLDDYSLRKKFYIFYVLCVMLPLIVTDAVVLSIVENAEKESSRHEMSSIASAVGYNLNSMVMRRVPFPICANCPPSKKTCPMGSFVPVKNAMARSAPIEEATTSSRRSTPCDFRYSST